MSEETQRPIPAIDQIANGSHLMMLKATLPYLPWSNQRIFAFYIKAMEISNLMNFYRTPADVHACATTPLHTSPVEMPQDIRCYCCQADQENIDQCLSLLQMMELYQTLQKSGNGTDAMKNLLSPEQQAIFETYQSMFQDS